MKSAEIPKSTPDNPPKEREIKGPQNDAEECNRVCLVATTKALERASPRRTDVQNGETALHDYLRLDDSTKRSCACAMWFELAPCGGIWMNPKNPKHFRPKDPKTRELGRLQRTWKLMISYI